MKKPTTELSDKEWKSRKLSKFGYISAMLDLVLLAFYFLSAIILGSRIVPYMEDPSIRYFCILVTGILIMLGMKICVRLMNIRTEYQTIIVREEMNQEPA